MSNLRRTLTPALAVCLAAVTVTACSSSGGGNAKPLGRTGLAKIVVQQGDLPSGWTGKPADSADSGDSDVQQQLLDCVGVSGIKKSDQIAQVHSDDFSQGQTTVSSDASSYKTKSAIDKRVAVLKSSKADGCLTTSFKKGIATSLPSGATVDKESFHITQGSSGGPGNVVATATGSVTVTAQGQTVSVHLDVAFITGSLRTATVEFIGLGQTVDKSLQAKLIKAVADRASG